MKIKECYLLETKDNRYIRLNNDSWYQEYGSAFELSWDDERLEKLFSKGLLIMEKKI